ncbi:putative telomere length regulation protein [Elsinoe fawcettii]|nr:putative telomere length regulation protein [Elsinoe fawcettii]
MSDFLSAVSTVSLRTKIDTSENRAPLISEVHNVPTTSAVLVEPGAPSKPSSPEHALESLKAHPSEREFHNILRYFIETSSQHFDIRIPSPRASNILRHLITIALPDFWRTSRTSKELLLSCLRSVPGIAGIVAEIRAATDRLVAPKQPRPSVVATSDRSDHGVIEMLERLFSEHDLVSQIWQQVAAIENGTQRRLLWRDFVGLLSSGKLVATVARYEDVLYKDSKSAKTNSWLANGKDFACKLGAQMADMLLCLDSQDDSGWIAGSDLFSKCASLGYTEHYIHSAMTGLLQRGQDGMKQLEHLVLNFRAPEQKRFLRYLLESLRKLFAGSDPRSVMRASALLITTIISQTELLEQDLASWLSDPKACCTVSQVTRRSAVAALNDKSNALQHVFEENIKSFGDIIFIQHGAAVQQETCAEILLLSTGQLSRHSPTALRFLARSSAYTQMVSNRLNASSEKSRTLGMCVGMAISALIDQDDQQLKFDIQDLKTEWAKDLMALTNVDDKVGTFDDIKVAIAGGASLKARNSTPSNPRKPPKLSISSTPKSVRPKKAKQTQVMGRRIVEVMSDEEDDASTEADLTPYPKPDSDPEDSDDDPTLVNRDKPKTPVYIRDLIAGLQDQEKYDRHKLALENASQLIRRKAQFGKEVSDHATELGLVLIGLQDYFELDRFIEMRLQALIALLISNPAELAPWYAQQAFEGDYSLSQRGTVLSAIGLAARELAGYTDTDVLNPAVTSDSFPSKRLPERYHAIYSTTSAQNPLNAITSSLTSSILAPITAAAADAASGPSVLKTRTFSSRVSSTSQRARQIPNNLAKLLYTSFFDPLIGHFHRHTSSMHSSRARNIYLQPHFLTTYLKTLAILIHASGAGTVSLPALTSEFWSLLLALRGEAKEDPSVMEAVLFGLLTLLEVNEDTRRLAEEHGREIVETREWVSMVFEKLNSGGRIGGEGERDEDRVRGLAAGVLVKCGEVMQKWERLMVGEMMDY